MYKVKALIDCFYNSSLVLINGTKASEEDMKRLIVNVLNGKDDYALYVNGSVTEIITQD